MKRRDLLYNPVNPLVRIEEGRLLSTETMNQLLAATTFDQACGILSGTVYGDFVAQSDFPMRHEYYLRLEQSRLFNQFYQIVPEKEVIDLFSLRYSYHNLKLLTKARFINQDLAAFFIPDGRYSLSTIESAIQNRQSSEIKDLMMESIIEVTSYLETYPISSAIDFIYDRYYLRHLKQSANRLNYSEITEIVNAFIDLTNISTVIRAKKKQQSYHFLETVLSSSGAIPKSSLLQYATGPIPDFLDYVMDSPYREVLELLVTQDNQTVNTLLLQREIDDYITKLTQVAKVQAFGPVPLLSLMQAKDTEIKNIQLILIGLRNHFDKTVIQERIRMSYGT